jgi:hypothetical protein
MLAKNWVATGPGQAFKRGDHVEWNSEAGRVRGVILKKVVSTIRFKSYLHHAYLGVAGRLSPEYTCCSQNDNGQIAKASVPILNPTWEGRANE